MKQLPIVFLLFMTVPAAAGEIAAEVARYRPLSGLFHSLSTPSRIEIYQKARLQFLNRPGSKTIRFINRWVAAIRPLILKKGDVFDDAKVVLLQRYYLSACTLLDAAIATIQGITGGDTEKTAALRGCVSAREKELATHNQLALSISEGMKNNTVDFRMALEFMFKVFDKKKDLEALLGELKNKPEIKKMLNEFK